MTKMSDLGFLASRYHINTNSLKKFNSTLRYFKSNDVDQESFRYRTEVSKILSVLKPVCEALEGYLAKSLIIDDGEIVEILSQKHSNDWQRYKNLIVSITQRLEIAANPISSEELDALEDVADAIDIECAMLFRRMRGRV